MATETERRGEGRQARQRGARRLVAGLRISQQDERLLEVVRPLLPEAISEGELAYRLWRRGLELTLAEAAGLGASLPPGISEELIARLVAQRLMLCVPILRHTGMLTRLGIEAIQRTAASPTTDFPEASTLEADVMDMTATATIVGFGGDEFL